MRFIITAQANPDGAAATTEPGFDEKLFSAYMQFNEEMHQAGVLVASEGLNPAAPGARVVVSNGRRKLADGPFTESKELVGGFYLIDVPFARGGHPVGAARAERIRQRRRAGSAAIDRRRRHPARDPALGPGCGAEVDGVVAGAGVERLAAVSRTGTWQPSHHKA
jgi:hypothetical protein